MTQPLIPIKISEEEIEKIEKSLLEDKPIPNGDNTGRYELMAQAGTYALGVEAVRSTANLNPFIMDNGSKIYRPLTFKENIEARVNDYNTEKNPDGSIRTEEERQRFFTTWLDSCTGIAYKGIADKKKSTKFKIIPECRELITIDRTINGEFLPVDYDSLQGIELDSSKGIYNVLLTKDKILNHEAWNEAVQDKSLLKNYADIVFSLKKGKLMGFWTRSNTDDNELRALCINCLGSYSGAYGDYDLCFSARFLRAAQK